MMRRHESGLRIYKFDLFASVVGSIITLIAMLLLLFILTLIKEGFDFLVIEGGELHDVLEGEVEIILYLIVLLGAINNEVVEPVL